MLFCICYPCLELDTEFGVVVGVIINRPMINLLSDEEKQLTFDLVNKSFVNQVCTCDHRNSVAL